MPKFQPSFVRSWRGGVYQYTCYRVAREPAPRQSGRSCRSKQRYNCRLAEDGGNALQEKMEEACLERAEKVKLLELLQEFDELLDGCLLAAPP
ncbi:hypothetical protein SKAU_G00208450 [Synaphobranchus kaupii]|uniref:Uncharacterized protein n=1 Tax=Synaphobranchus kaupii TaxID=118154 RepID=A0A9Q1F8V7_SYNKA|nr:hypothetical protein SKAU_G00208450 [Synaphobranchus kaupii]